MRSALTGKTEHRFPEHGPSYTVEESWEPWNASEKARAEARVWLKTIGDFEKPLDRGACDAAIVELGNAVSMPKMSKDEAKGRLRTYHAALADLPGRVVLAGLKEAILVCKWFPSVAELRGLMEPRAKELRLQIERARTLARKSEPRPKLAAPKVKGFGDMTSAQKATHERQMAELRAEIGTDDAKDRRPHTNYVRMSDAEKKEIFEKWENEARGKVA